MDKQLKKEDEDILICGTDFVFDPHLSLRAKGLLISMLALQNDIHINFEDVNLEELTCISSDVMKALVDELTNRGYLSETDKYYKISSSPRFKI